MKPSAREYLKNLKKKNNREITRYFSNKERIPPPICNYRYSYQKDQRNIAVSRENRYILCNCQDDLLQ